MVLLQQIENRDRSFVLDVGAAAHHGVLVESDARDPPLTPGLAHGCRSCPGREPDRQRQRVGLQPFRLGEMDRRGCQRR